MSPTRAGQKLVNAAEVVEHELESATHFLQELAHQRETTIRLTTQCYTLYRWLPFVIRDLYREFPGLCADVVPEATDQPYEALGRDEIDVALVSQSDRGEGFESVPLFDDELYAVMSTGHPLADRKFLNPANFRDQALVLYSGTRHAILDEVLHPAGVFPERVIQVRITEAIIELVRAGQGIAVLAGWAFNDIDNSGLTAARITRGGMRRQWHAAISRQCPEPYAEALVRAVQHVGKTLQHSTWRKALQEDHG